MTRRIEVVVLTATGDEDTTEEFSLGGYAGGGVFVPSTITTLTFWAVQHLGTEDGEVRPVMASGTTTQLTVSVPAGGGYVELPYELHGAMGVRITVDTAGELVVNLKS